MSSESGTSGIDLDAVTRWFEANVPAAAPPLAFDRVAGGHSCLTYIVTDAAGERFVLRRPPLGAVLESAHDVAREYRVMAALADTGVPVPRMLGLCTDASVNDAPFYVMSHVAGVVLHDAGDVEAKLPGEDNRRRAAETLIDALVALHAVDLEAVGLGELARPTSFIDRQLKRWSRQWDASKTRELPGMDQLRDWLTANRPDEHGAGIVHGDYRLGNVIHGEDGTVLAVLDWELCTVGDPLADVSYLLNSWVHADEVGVRSGAASTAPGFPRRDELCERYAAGSGRDLADLDYWAAFHAWRSAAICEGVYRRYIDGDMGTVPDDVDRYRIMVEQGCERGLQLAGLATR
jgi:aminoglycoside phosphotransferase (APT) family kinase protein